MPRCVRTPALALLLTAAALLAAPTAQGGIPLGGLAVAVTADGARLVAGGDTRAIYELDPASLEVKRRVYLGRSIVALAFSPDGKRLWVESTKAVQMLDGGTLEVLTTIEDVERMEVAAGAGLVAVLSRRPAAVRILSMADGSEKAAVPYDRMQTVAAFGLQPDGSTLALLYGRKTTEEEPKVGYKEIPKDLKGAALNEFKQRNDGYRAQFLLVDVATGKPTLDTQLWYGAPGGGYRVGWAGADACIVGYKNENARITPKGEVTYFELGNSYNYGMGFSADRATVLTGGLRAGSRTTLADGKAVALELDARPGFPEYWKDFAFAADGTGFGGTSGYRVGRIDAAGAIVKLVPVF